MTADIQLALKIEPLGAGTLYLSVSWQPDDGKQFGYKVIEYLDRETFLPVGDARDLPDMSLPRLERIMGAAEGFVSVMPHRPGKPTKTAAFMLEELELAVRLRLPIAILADQRIPIVVTTDPTTHSRSFAFDGAKTVAVPGALLVSFAQFDFGDRDSEQKALFELNALLERCKAAPRKPTPYGFVIARLQPDFEAVRRSLVSASETATGLRCIHLDSAGYTPNITDTTERARVLIREAQFVVADISIVGDEGEFDSPSRAHEIGLAIAYRKPLFLTSQLPRRELYHGIVGNQVLWWPDEESLYRDLSAKLHAERASIARHVYSRSVAGLRADGHPLARVQALELGDAPRWRGTLAHDERSVRGWIYAICFGVSVLCASVLLRRLTGFTETIDFAACLAGVVTFLFASSLHRRLRALLRNSRSAFHVTWIATLALLALVVLTTPRARDGDERASEAEGGSQSRPTEVEPAPTAGS